MSILEFKCGDIVEHKDGRKGVVVDDFPGMMHVCGSGEVLVVYDGGDCGIGTNETDLTKIGEYEKKIEDPKKCGLGCGKSVCKYLGFSSAVGGAGCLRFSDLRNEILFRVMEAKGAPTKLFPECQEEISTAAKASS